MWNFINMINCFCCYVQGDHQESIVIGHLKSTVYRNKSLKNQDIGYCEKVCVVCIYIILWNAIYKASILKEFLVHQYEKLSFGTNGFVCASSSFMFVLQQQNAPKPLKISFDFPLQVGLVQCHESNIAFSQQFYFLDKEPFGNECLNL